MPIDYRPEIELPTTKQLFINKLKHNMQNAITIANKNTKSKVNLSKIRLIDSTRFQAVNRIMKK